jgi:hypothetical protein
MPLIEVNPSAYSNHLTLDRAYAPMRKILVVFALAALAAFGANVDGKWTYEMQGRDGEKREASMTLKAEGDKLTGTMQGRQGDRPIENGKINGDEISFETTINMGGESRKLLYKGKVEGDQLKLTMSSSGGEFTRDIVAKRAQ